MIKTAREKVVGKQLERFADIHASQKAASACEIGSKIDMVFWAQQRWESLFGMRETAVRSNLTDRP